MKLLLHSCCAPCSAAIIEWLLNNGIKPSIYYFNPNIFPQEEYLKRKAECSRYAEALNIEIIDGDWCHESWLCKMNGMENEAERGKRCLECFKFRLLKTAEYAASHNFDTITTTLASSRWKSLEQISSAGSWAVSQVSGVTFWDKNWRKDGLQERRRILIKENAFYNQLYCGCEFSLNNSKQKQ